MKFTPLAKALLVAFGLAGTGGGSLYHYATAEEPEPEPVTEEQRIANLISTIDDELTEIRKPARLRAQCGETVGELNGLFSRQGISATFTAPYTTPTDADPYGACALSINGQSIANVDKPDFFSNESWVDHTVRTIADNLSTENDLVKLRAAVPQLLDVLKP